MARRSWNHESAVVDAELDGAAALHAGDSARATDRKAEDEGWEESASPWICMSAPMTGVGAEEIGRRAAAISTSAATASRWSALFFPFFSFVFCGSKTWAKSRIWAGTAYSFVLICCLQSDYKRTASGVATSLCRIVFDGRGSRSQQNTRTRTSHSGRRCGSTWDDWRRAGAKETHIIRVRKSLLTSTITNKMANFA